MHTVKQCPEINTVIPYSSYKGSSYNCDNNKQPYKTICNFTCDVGYENLAFNNDRECLSNKTWSRKGETFNCSSLFYNYDIIHF